MRIYDMVNDKAIDSICLFLTPDEAKAVVEHLTRMISRPIRDHGHIESDDDTTDLTVCVYEVSDLTGFHPRARELILTSK